MLRRAGAIARREVETPAARLRGTRALHLEPDRSVMRRLLEPEAQRHRTRRKRAEMTLGQRTYLGGLDIAGDTEDRVIGGVPIAVEGERVGGAEPAHLVLPADRRVVIGGVQVQAGDHLL